MSLIIDPYRFAGGGGGGGPPTGQLQAVLDASPSIYLPLNNGDTADYGSVGATVTKTGSAAFTDTDTATGLSIVAFDGSTYFDCGDVVDDVTPSGGMVVMCAIKLADGNLDDFTGIIDKSNGSGGNGQYFLTYDNRSSQGSPHRARFQQTNDTVDYTVPNSGADFESWVVLHGRRSGSNGRFYVNGTEQTLSSGGWGTGSANTIKLTFGALANGTFPLNSGDRAQHFAVWTGTDLSDAEISDMATEFANRS